MRCLREAIGSTARYAYSHHIQRLMVTGNFALLAGIAPREIERWYLAVYADAFEWVEMPNTLGMAVFADGGQMASKPYAASGAYIDRMSDFCSGCAYDVKQKSGPRRLPVQLSLLGVSDPAERSAFRQSADGDALPHAGRMAARARSGDPRRSGRLSRSAR